LELTTRSNARKVAQPLLTTFVVSSASTAWCYGVSTAVAWWLTRTGRRSCMAPWWHHWQDRRSLCKSKPRRLLGGSIVVTTSI
jgi:hypothetical protein